MLAIFNQCSEKAFTTVLESRSIRTILIAHYLQCFVRLPIAIRIFPFQHNLLSIQATVFGKLHCYDQIASCSISWIATPQMRILHWKTKRKFRQKVRQAKRVKFNFSHDPPCYSYTSNNSAILKSYLVTTCSGCWQDSTVKSAHFVLLNPWKKSGICLAQTKTW